MEQIQQLLAHPTMLQLQQTAKGYATPDNASMAVSGLLVLAGGIHAIPGPTLKMQAKQIGLPAWFILCAGLLMLGSGIGYHFLPAPGLFFVAACMGGSATTGLNMPPPMPHFIFKLCPYFSAAFSLKVLCLALWANNSTKSLEIGTVIGVAASFAFGVVGVLKHTLISSTACKLLGKKKDKKEEPEKKADIKPAATKANGIYGIDRPAVVTRPGRSESPGAPTQRTSAAPATKAS